MTLREHDMESFYTYAMELFLETGHVTASETNYTNHSSEQFMYFDNRGEMSLLLAQRALLKRFNCVSYLFSVNNCAFFSMNLLTTRGNRSQVALDIHSMIHPITRMDGTICLFRFNDEVLFSFVGYGRRCVLSDWYAMDDDNECLIDKLSIANMSIESGHNYFFDMVYTLSRRYYLSSLPTIYELIPIDLISKMDSDTVDREELNRFIEYELAATQREYGDDYVEYDELLKVQPSNILADLDLMLLEIDDEDDNPFGEEIENPEEDDENAERDELFNEDEQLDEYEFDVVNPEIFRDPLLMVKWLNKIEDSTFEHK